MSETAPAPPPAAAAEPAATEPGATDLPGAVRATAEVVELLRTSAAHRIRLTVGDLSIDVERPGPAPILAAPAPAAPLPPQAPASPADAAPAAAPDQDGAARSGAGPDRVIVTAPLMGVLYRRPAPDQPVFVEPGQRVEAGQQVAIVEAMKMMNAVVADRAGVVAEIHVDEGEIVEFDQPLLSLQPVGEPAC